MPRQFGAEETVVLTDHTVLQTGYLFPPSCTRKPRECLEYIIVHEMVHLLEPTHNAKFIALMDRFMPKWQFYRDQLNRLPVSHEEWAY